MAMSTNPRTLQFPSEIPLLLPPLDAALPGDLALVDELLRDRSSLLERIDQGRDLTRLARAMIVTIAFCAAAFGAAAGAQRGGLQIALSAVKLPLALLMTAAICAPVLTSLNRVLLGTTDARKDLSVVLCSMALASLVTAALTPLVLLAANSPGMGYRRMVLVCVACAGLGGLIGVSFFVRSLRHYGGEERGFVGLTVLVVFALVGTQTTWTLRPYLGMPGTKQVIVHRVSGSFLDAVVTTSYTAAGLYVQRIEPAMRPTSEPPAPPPAADPTPSQILETLEAAP